MYHNDYSNVGGCQLKHLFNEDRRTQCEDAWYAKQGAKQSSAQADVILAQAAMAQSQQDTSWSPTQTAGVVIGSLLAIGIMAAIIYKVKNKKAK
jgi:hypothetical protein